MAHEKASITEEESSSESESESSEVQTKPKPANGAPAKTPAVPALVAKKPVVPAKKNGKARMRKSPSQCDWEESSEEESDEEPAAAQVAPPKKKGTLKAKLAEKEAEKAAKKNGNGKAESDDYDSDTVLDPKEKAKRDRERELKADLNNAADLLGAAALGGTSSPELDSLISFQPRTKEDFVKFSDNIIEFLIKRHQSKPLYHTFVEHHSRALAMPLKDVEIRKVASGLTTLANEKQKEQRDKASGKKKPKTSAKPALGGAKASARQDTSVYDEVLDDFGNDPNDFM
ncbi:translation initiation factor eIF3 subunit-domain-containing protein [Gymnopilus junonius]|uniref:Eukaryotic translation initiation factor 3 30 kDa subunit n=1 Tax=Gymnopilus junonius TaxID=109634 RepID=A0A9P5TSH4_GYMJU|nr:translation initiation factor eIF3 subunit-domain-containing protein [Gymnopilus junonius]